MDAIMALGDHPNIEDVVLILHAAKEAHLAAFPKPEDFGFTVEGDYEEADL